jgi:hypothetical protein
MQDETKPDDAATPQPDQAAAPNQPPHPTTPSEPPTKPPAPPVSSTGFVGWLIGEAQSLVNTLAAAAQNAATPGNLQTWGDDVIALAADFVPTPWRTEFTAFLDSVMAGEAPQASETVVKAIAVAAARLDAILANL